MIILKEYFYKYKGIVAITIFNKIDVLQIISFSEMLIDKKKMITLLKEILISNKRNHLSIIRSVKQLTSSNKNQNIN